MSRPVVDPATGLTQFDPSRDNERVFDEEIQPHIEEILAVCAREGIQFAAVTQFSAAGHAINYCATPGYSGLVAEVLLALRPDLLQQAAEQKKPDPN